MLLKTSEHLLLWGKRSSPETALSVARKEDSSGGHQQPMAVSCLSLRPGACGQSRVFPCNSGRFQSDWETVPRPVPDNCPGGPPGKHDTRHANPMPSEHWLATQNVIFPEASLQERWPVFLHPSEFGRTTYCITVFTVKRGLGTRQWREKKEGWRTGYTSQHSK